MPRREKNARSKIARPSVDGGGGPVLEVEHLSKSFGPHAVLADISLALERGTISVLAGGNGAGKSTFLRCLTGLSPFRGAATVDGVPIGSRDARRRIGYLPQNVALPDTVTVGEVIAFFSRLRGVPQDDSGLPEGFLPAAERSIGILSGGQRQRVALAVALLGGPSLLLLDEPVANLDEGGRASFWETLRELRNMGTTTLVASPLPADLAGVAERAIVLSEGVVVHDGPVDGLRPITLLEGGLAEAADGNDDPSTLEEQA